MKLTQEDALALSYLTPGLSRRIQKQLFAQLSCPDGTQNSTLPRRRQSPLTADARLAESSSLGKLRYQAKETSDGNVRPQQTRKVSRFLRPDFYDNAQAATPTNVGTNQTNKPAENLFYKEKKEREMETQKVLKEIRDKRIKNRLSVRRERSMSREKEMAPTKSGDTLTGYSKIVENKSCVHQDVCKVVEVPKDIQEKSIPDYVNVPANKKERVSKLIRPKSYPNAKSPDSSSIEAPKSAKPNKTERSLKTPETTNAAKVKSTSGTKNKFLQSIEKKFEKLRSLNNDETTKKSCVESAIRKLREHSVPRQSEALITESTLIKRAVSVEDCTTNASLLQPSRKSVTKILGLFKKYEDKDKAVVKQRERTKSPDATLLLNEISETNIPRPKKLSGDLMKAKSPDLVVEQHRERPKSLMIETGMKNGAVSGQINGTTEGTYKSRLPLMNNRRSLQIDDNAQSNNNQLSPVTPTDNRIQFSENSIINDIAQRRANQRKLNLQLDLSATNSNQLLTPDNDSSCTLLSPYDDTVSCSGDSWSACSDQGLTTSQGQSHVESNGNDLDGGEVNAGESVIDRIRRKSFYSRFNDQRRSRKTSFGSGSIAGSYRDLDLYRYRDYNPPSNSTTPTHNSEKRSYSRSSSYMPDYTITSELATATLDRKRQQNRPYGRSTSMLHEYVNMPSSATIGCDSARGENNARLLSYTRLYHDDNNGNGYNGAGVDADGDDVDAKLCNRYKRYNYRSSSNASTRCSVSPSPSTAHVHNQPTITAINNSVVNSHLKSSTSACLHNDKY